MSERDYVRPGGVNLHPGSLEEFATWMGTDQQAFEDGKGAVEQDCFAGVPMPWMFAGEMTEDAGGTGLPEAESYALAYGELENGLRIMLMQIGGGLLALQSAASFVHTAYLMTDGLGAEESANAFAAYNPQKVQDTFSGHGFTVSNMQDSEQLAGGELPMVDEQWQQRVDEQRAVDIEEEQEDGGLGTDNPERPPEVRLYDRVQHMDVDVDGDQATLDVPGSYPTREPQPHPIPLEERDG